MRTVRDVPSLRAAVAGWKASGQTVGVVPTMGALHPGHISLIDAARHSSDRVVASIFVNPRQFDNPGDLAKYPRTEDSDAGMLAAAGVDLLFAPSPETVYPAGFATRVTVAGLSEGLCGAYRPGHFDGVATVVTKLFLMTGADKAFFGEKDWQQLQIVRRLARDLNIPIAVTGCPTLRDADGLALSSRNARLSPAARKVAPALHKAMTAAGKAIREGAPVAEALALAEEQIVAAGFDRVEYLELRRAESLDPAPTLDAPSRLLAAAWLDDVRLIDNIAVLRD